MDNKLFTNKDQNKVINELGGKLDNSIKSHTKEDNQIFKGFGNNVNYEDPSIFLTTLRQTKATERVKKVTKK